MRLSGKLAFALAGSLSIPALFAHGQTIGPSEAVISQTEQGSRHIMNLRDVEIGVLIDDVSTITGNTFVVHPSVRGKVTVSSQQPLTNDEVFQVFLSTLRVNGFAIVPASGGSYKIVPENVSAAEAGLARRNVVGDQVETAVLSLNNFDAVEAARMLKPIINPDGLVVASAESNKIVVVDYAGNLARVRSVIAQIDQDRATVETVPLANVSASEMAKMVNSLTTGSNAAFNLDIGAIPLESGNTLVLKGDRADVIRVLDIVERLDNESRPSEDSLKVMRINHGTAEELAPILESLALTMTEAATVGAEAKKPTVAVHPPTNSVIISAAPPVLRELERVVSELDVRRSQVLVEAIVVELSDTTTRELGLQFAVAGTGSSDVPVAITNFSSTTPNILGLAGALLGSNDGDGETSSSLTNAALASLAGTSGGLFGFGGEDGDGNLFGVIVNAVDQDVDSNVLSTPSVMALDNETAKILSGQEIPITTGETLGSDNSNPFRTVTRQEVGISLEVTPQISEGNTVHMNINQTVSGVVGAVGDSTDFITNKREVQTTILADDGDIIILGGLIQEDEEKTVSKVPFLGDIPLLGRAFRSEFTSVERTNLMVFLRPTIVRDAQTVRSLTDRRYNYIRDAQIGFNSSGDASIDRILEEVMGETAQ